MWSWSHVEGPRHVFYWRFCQELLRRYFELRDRYLLQVFAPSSCLQLYHKNVHIQFIITFMIYFHSEFHLWSCNILLLIVVKVKSDYTFRALIIFSLPPQKFALPSCSRYLWNRIKKYKSLVAFNAMMSRTSFMKICQVVQDLLKGHRDMAISYVCISLQRNRG